MVSQVKPLKNGLSCFFFQKPCTFLHSAGAGRTGAYIAIDYLTQQLQEEAKVNVMKLILTMREYRKDMVQNVVRLLLIDRQGGAVVSKNIFTEAVIAKFTFDKGFVVLR